MTTSRTGGVPSSAAYTLIELLVAVVLLAGGLAGILAAHQACLSALEVSHDRLRATDLLRERLDAACADGLPLVRQGGFEGEDRHFSWELEVRPVPGPDPALQEVAVAVRSERTGRIHTLTAYRRDPAPPPR